MLFWLRPACHRILAADKRGRRERLREPRMAEFVGAWPGLLQVEMGMSMRLPATGGGFLGYRDVFLTVPSEDEGRGTGWLKGGGLRLGRGGARAKGLVEVF
jgi:hypothetical protein